MKANELSVGDWVCAKMTVINGEERLTPPMRVVAIGDTWVQLLVDPKSGYPDKYVIDDIRPIPLTADILIDNGLKPHIPKILRWADDATNGRHAINAQVEKDGEIYIETISPLNAIVVAALYVHTLQHAMRLAGIEKEIKL